MLQVWFEVSAFLQMPWLAELTNSKDAQEHSTNQFSFAEFLFFYYLLYEISIVDLLWFRVIVVTPWVIEYGYYHELQYDCNFKKSTKTGKAVSFLDLAVNFR
jgi:hypothetical protein